jgi:hypothetical protein
MNYTSKVTECLGCPPGDPDVFARYVASLHPEGKAASNECAVSECALPEVTTGILEAYVSDIYKAAAINPGGWDEQRIKNFIRAVLQSYAESTWKTRQERSS